VGDHQLRIDKCLPDGHLSLNLNPPMEVRFTLFLFLRVMFGHGVRAEELALVLVIIDILHHFLLVSGENLYGTLAKSIFNV
jgi:hypothetical protein